MSSRWVIGCLFALATTPALAQSDAGFTQLLKQSSLARSTANLQNGIAARVNELTLENESNRRAQSSHRTKHLAVFKPSPSENLRLIADELGKNDEEKALYRQLFVEIKKNFEAQVASNGNPGMTNNLAAAMTFLLATAVTAYNEAADPSDAATLALFHTLNRMFDEMPAMAAVSDKDKQFLYDAYLSYGGLALTFYTGGKDSNDADLIKVARVMAGSLLLEYFAINPNTIFFEGDKLKRKDAPNDSAPAGTDRSTQHAPTVTGSHSFAKRTTNFDDGWIANPTEEYVSLRRSGTEVRLYYADKALDDALPPNTQYADYYWRQLVAPHFDVGNTETWAGVGPDLEYMVQGDAVDKRTGQRLHVVLWNVNNNAARGNYVVVAPTRAAFQQLFPNRGDISKMRGYNKFAVTTQDLLGAWQGGSGNFATYYSVYTGSYVGTNALSVDNDFVFRSNGSYQHVYRSANTNFGGTQFAKLEYNGKFSVANDWEITATNHDDGLTARFTTHIVAVRGGYLLVMRDVRNDITYTVFRTESAK
jgi:hypothetical protein